MTFPQGSFGESPCNGIWALHNKTMDTGLVHHLVCLLKCLRPSFNGTHFAELQRDGQSDFIWRS